ncbi:MAG: alkaline phosphatase family protein [Bacteroidetes bacterium]|nr:MAG: alkaline phosphatase family protein [Bacteroidota bacterium]
MNLNNIYRGVFGLILLVVLSCHAPQKTVEKGASEAPDQPIVLLISLDGYRWDYTRRFNPPNLTRFVETGVQARSMWSCFPSKTFPNHYSIATGMYPENHNLVDNSFYDAEKNAVYKISNREMVEDGTWYGGTPIWVQAAKAGLVTASYFFVGSEADIQGIRPTYYRRYDGSVPNTRRVKQILEWLALPETERPRLITAYFSDMDDAGHRYGPDDDARLSETLDKLDGVLGKLFEGIKATGLPVNVIIVSDHGMMGVPVSQLIPVESVEDDDRYLSVSNGALIHLYLREGVSEKAVFEDLKNRENHWTVYSTKQMPYYQKNPGNPRLGDLIIVPETGWYFSGARQIGLLKAGGRKVVGHHGFDPELPEMHAIFYANGPAFKKGLTIEPFRNIHVYPLICSILGLPVPDEVDGDPKVLSGILDK